MSIRVRCHGCKKVITAPAKYAGRTVQCPGCKTQLKIPSEAGKTAEKTVLPTKSKQPLAEEGAIKNRSVGKTAPFKISIPTKSGSADTRPDFGSLLGRLTGRSGASNPGRIPLNPIRYGLSRPLWPIVLALACIAGFGLAGKQIITGKIKLPGANATRANSSGSRPATNFIDQVNGRLQGRGAARRNPAQGVSRPAVQPSAKPTELEKENEREQLGKLAMLILFPLGGMVLYFRDRVCHFMRGDGNPGIVLSVNPTLIAVATDMSLDGDPYPAVKVFRTGLKTSQKNPLKVGDVIGTVSQYSVAAGNQGHFADFSPLPADLATSRPAHLASLTDSFDREQYQQAVHAISCLSQPYRPGLFYVGGKGAAEEMPKGLFATIRGLFTGS